jgi:hypothetical protein
MTIISTSAIIAAFKIGASFGSAINFCGASGARMSSYVNSVRKRSISAYILENFFSAILRNSAML